jgi:hypothetical protein
MIGCVTGGNECQACIALGCIAVSVDLDGLNVIDDVVGAKRTDEERHCVGFELEMVLTGSEHWSSDVRGWMDEG